MLFTKFIKRYHRMKFLLYFICYCLLFLVVSCQQRKVPMQPLAVQPFEADSALSVDWQEMETDYLLSYPENIILTDSHLIIQDRRATDYLFHAINRNDGSLDFEFARRGNGPQEFIDATLNSYWDSERQMISFYDPGKRTLFYFQKQGIEYVLNDCFAFSRQKKIQLESEYVREVFVCDSDYILMGEHGAFDEKRFLVLNNDLQIINRCEDYPNIKDLLSNPAEDLRKILYGFSFFKISPNGEKAVFATYRGALLQFFDLNNYRDSIRNIRSYQLEYPIKKEQITEEHDGWVYGFEDVYVTNDFVYAIYNGETAEDNPMFGKYILVFNWEGKLCKSYQLNLSLRCLAVDEKLGVIYVVACTENTDFFIACIHV